MGERSASGAAAVVSRPRIRSSRGRGSCGYVGGVGYSIVASEVNLSQRSPPPDFELSGVQYNMFHVPSTETPSPTLYATRYAYRIYEVRYERHTFGLSDTLGARGQIGAVKQHV